MPEKPQSFKLRGIRRLLTRDEYNEHILYRDAAIQAIIGSGITAFLSVYLVRLGASDMLVGLLTSLPALVMTIMALPAAAFIQRKGDLVKAVNSGRSFFRFGLSTFAVLPYISTLISPYLLVFGRSLLSCASAVGNVSVTTILGAATAEKRRANMLSMRLAINGLSAAVVGFLAGQWLNWAPYPINYSLLFGFAIVPAIFGNLNMKRLKISASALPQEKSKQRLNFSGMMALVKEAPAFRKYAILVLIFRLSLQMPAALYSIYRVREVGASDAWIGIILTVQQLFSTLSYFGLSRLLRRQSIRRWLWLTCVATMLYPILTALATTPPQLLASAVAGGIFNSGFNIFLTETLYRVSPKEQRPPFAAANAMINNICAFVGPLLGTAISGLVGIQAALWIIGGFRLLTGSMMGLLAKTKQTRI